MASISASTSYSDARGVYIQAQVIGLTQSYWDNWEDTSDYPTYEAIYMTCDGEEQEPTKSSVNCYSTLCRWTNLAPETSYTITAEIHYITGSGVSGVTNLSKTITSASEPEPAVTVDPWSWSASNGSASAAQTQNALTAINNHGPLTDFSYLVWNDMVSKVHEIQQAIGGYWSETFATYAATKMSPSDKALTAARFNSLRNNIGRYYSTGINEVLAGDIIYGSYFIRLANCLNYWIAQEGLS